MSEPDIEKKRKKRRRSARVYVNANRPLAVPLSEIADYFPPDDDDDTAATVKRRISQAERKRLAREGKAVVNPDGHISYPVETVEDLHAAATLARTGHGDVKAARKLIARRAKELGVANPLESAAKSMFNHPDPYGEVGYGASRTSAPITEGHASPSTGDHGVGLGRNSSIAAHHPDLRQSNTSFDQVLASLRTVRGDRTAAEIGLAGFAEAGEVTVHQFDAAGQAGHYHDMQAVSSSPMREDWHQSRGSATPPNGSHSIGNPLGNAPMSMKASDRREIMRRALFPGSGGAR